MISCIFIFVDESQPKKMFLFLLRLASAPAWILAALLFFAGTTWQLLSMRVASLIHAAIDAVTGEHA